MTKASGFRKIDPAILLNDGPWDDFDAVCAAEYHRLKQDSFRRWAYLLASLGGALGLCLTGLLWLLELSYINSYFVVYILSLGFAGAVWFYRYRDIQPGLHLVAATAAVLMFYSAVVVLFSALTHWAGMAVDQGRFYVLIGGGYLTFLVLSKWTALGSFHTKLVAALAQTFGWSYQYTATKFPTGEMTHLGQAHAPKDIRDHVSGEWRGVEFHAGRYKHDDEVDHYLLLHFCGIGFTKFAGEATTHKQFPDEGPDMKSDMHSAGAYKVRLQAGKPDTREWALMNALLDSVAQEARGAPVYIAMDDGVVMVFIQRADGVFPFDETRLAFDPDSFFARFEQEFVTIARVADTVASARKTFLYG